MDEHNTNIYSLSLIISFASFAALREKKIISVGMSAFGLERVLEIVKQYDQIYPALGIHPEEVRLNKNIEKKVVLNVDKEHLLLESDGPVEYSGKIGTPAMTREVLNLISKFKEIPADELELQIEKNTQSIFPKIF